MRGERRCSVGRCQRRARTMMSDPDESKGRGEDGPLAREAEQLGTELEPRGFRRLLVDLELRAIVFDEQPDHSAVAHELSRLADSEDWPARAPQHVEAWLLPRGRDEQYLAVGGIVSVLQLPCRQLPPVNRVA